MRVRLGALAGAVCALMAAAAGDAVAAPEQCRAEGRACMLLTVPLDRSGAVPGTVRLRVERSRTAQSRQPPLFVILGLPGESSRAAAENLDFRLEGASLTRDIVTMDLRGTGRSGPLRCPSLEGVPLAHAPAAAAARCAASLGTRRAFYTARESADDVEAVRKALGIDRIALLGSSYGAQVAFAYAQRYPGNVDRLVLDSIPGPEGFDSLYRRGFAAVRQTVQVLCRKDRCHRASADPVGDVVRLARRLERGPLRGTLRDAFGRSRMARIDAFDLFEGLLRAVDGDRAFMGYVRNALRGDPAPLLRHLRQSSFDLDLLLLTKLLNPAAYAASRCEESVLPWSRDTPLAERPLQAAAFVDALPADPLASFGPRAALGSDVLELCRRWPMASAAPDPPRPLPPMPTLLVAGVDDMLAPVSAGRAVANLIPGSRLLRLRGAGHGTFSSYADGSSCAVRITAEFLAGAMPKGVCGPEWKASRGASAPPPLSLAEVTRDPRVDGRAGRTLTAVNATIRDGGEIVQQRYVERLLELTSVPRSEWPPPREALKILSAAARAGGLRGGTYELSLSKARLTLRRASYVPGVRISGSIVLAQDSERRKGVLRIGGPAAARGTLTIRGGVMTGRLGGQRVRAPSRWGSGIGLSLR